MKGELRAIPLGGIGEVKPGDSLPAMIIAALKRQRLKLERGDILVVTHKVVSKSEGRLIPLVSVKPSARARRWAAPYGRDPRLLELALRESRRVVRRGRGLLITETRHGEREGREERPGFVCAQSGVDVSNVDGGRSAALLPRDPDLSARRLRQAIKKAAGLAVAIIITDSFGRPWREGLTEVAIGASGLRVLRDERGRRDAYGYRLHATQEAVADELAGMAGLACGKLSRQPVCLIRGLRYQPGRGRARDLIRRPEQDLFR
ncbi:MAG TPA: coenzyme F420-0:L-glutamate ligase [Terriglobia bacterium]|nr:coenzyme F420-0:L-glutamate ligase [Terriglobia bacterium]